MKGFDFIPLSRTMALALSHPHLEHGSDITTAPHLMHSKAASLDVWDLVWLIVTGHLPPSILRLADARFRKRRRCR
jgi:hypothetical protein